MRVGLIVNMRSFLGIFHLYVVEKGDLREINTYRFSQDHLETFFSAIRSRGGNNNNPTARQFKAAFKRLIIHNSVRASVKGNCIDFDEVRMLHIQHKAQFYLDSLNIRSQVPVSIDLDYDLADLNLALKDDNFLESEFTTSATVQKNVLKKVKCEECLMELTKTSRTTAHKDIVKIAKLVKLEFKILVGENATFNVPKYYQRFPHNQKPSGE